MSDQEYVRAHWEWVHVRLAEPFEGIPEGEWTARLPLLPFSWSGFETEAEAWAAAAEFTRQRLEQIRQLEREKETVEDNRDFERLQLEMLPFWSEDDPMPVEADFDTQADCVVFWVKRIFANVRILARLESALADLKRGMK